MVEQQNPMPEVPPVPTSQVEPEAVPQQVAAQAPEAQKIEKEVSPVKINWKKPIILILIIGALALAAMFLIGK